MWPEPAARPLTRDRQNGMVTDSPFLRVVRGQPTAEELAALVSVLAARAAAERRVEPYGLVATGRRWYALAFDLGRDDWRTLRLDRMSEVRATTWHFRPREAPDPAEYVQRAVTVSPYPHEARVLVHAPAAVVRERVTPASGSVEEVDEQTCRVVAGGHSLDALLWHFGTLGHAFTIEGPEELRAAAEAFGSRVLGAIS